ncbi:protein of unknown function [Nitrospina watsonii]|uniref:Uncharacterized protein n=1 Tax=Nitrospina watsonii TaxID=1323948 RepID=A0ABN8VU20_9BACT|nr:protein of unknown function [Nitrospina watsonii]
MDGLLVLGMVVFGFSLWLLSKDARTPARIRRDDPRRTRRR